MPMTVRWIALRYEALENAQAPVRAIPFSLLGQIPGDLGPQRPQRTQRVAWIAMSVELMGGLSWGIGGKVSGVEKEPPIPDPRQTCPVAQLRRRRAPVGRHRRLPHVRKEVGHPSSTFDIDGMNKDFSVTSESPVAKRFIATRNAWGSFVRVRRRTL